MKLKETKKLARESIPAKKGYAVTVGSQKYALVLPGHYDGELGTVCGFAELTDGENIRRIDEIIPAIGRGDLARIRIRYKDADTAITYSASLVCDIDKAPGATAALINKDFRACKIISASLPTRRRLG